MFDGNLLFEFQEEVLEFFIFPENRVLLNVLIINFFSDYI